MTVKELFDFIKGVRPGFAFNDAQMMVWLNEIEGKVQTDIMLLDPAVGENGTVTGLVEYDVTTDMDTELIVPFPWNKLYRYFMLMSIDLYNGEFQRYGNSFAQFNEAYEEYAAWYAQNIAPANGLAVAHGYYLTAYQFAVRGGFVGTEEQFSKALNGIVSSMYDKPSVTFEQFGAVGDGVTDDTEAIDEAILFAINDNCNVHVLGKTYIKGYRTQAERMTLRENQDLTIYGDGWNSVLKLPDNVLNTVYDPGIDQALLYFAVPGGSTLTLRDFATDGNFRNQTKQHEESDNSYEYQEGGKTKNTEPNFETSSNVRVRCGSNDGGRLICENVYFKDPVGDGLVLVAQNITFEEACFIRCKSDRYTSHRKFKAMNARAGIQLVASISKLTIQGCDLDAYESEPVSGTVVVPKFELIIRDSRIYRNLSTVHAYATDYSLNMSDCDIEGYYILTSRLTGKISNCRFTQKYVGNDYETTHMNYSSRDNTLVIKDSTFNIRRDIHYAFNKTSVYVGGLAGTRYENCTFRAETGYAGQYLVRADTTRYEITVPVDPEDPESETVTAWDHGDLQFVNCFFDGPNMRAAIENQRCDKITVEGGTFTTFAIEAGRAISGNSSAWRTCLYGTITLLHEGGHIAEPVGAETYDGNCTLLGLPVFGQANNEEAFSGHTGTLIVNAYPRKWDVDVLDRFIQLQTQYYGSSRTSVGYLKGTTVYVPAISSYNYETHAQAFRTYTFTTSGRTSKNGSSAATNPGYINCLAGTDSGQPDSPIWCPRN